MNSITSPTHPLNPLNPISPTNPNGILYTEDTSSDAELTPELALILALMLLAIFAVFAAKPCYLACKMYIRSLIDKCTKR